MSKHHQQTKSQPTNRVATPVSVGTENPNQSDLPGSKSDAEFVPSYEEIQIRAYQIHEEKGGSDLENWLEAERLLKEEHQRG